MSQIAENPLFIEDRGIWLVEIVMKLPFLGNLLNLFVDTVKKDIIDETDILSAKKHQRELLNTLSGHQQTIHPN